MSDYSELKKLAEAATPQDFDSAEEKVENGYIECPHCGGSGEVELEADYCNYDSVAIGVQFYGIGHEFGAAEAYYRGARPAVVLALIADLNALAAQRDEGMAREAELKKELVQFQDGYTKQWKLREVLQQRLAEATDLLKHMTCSYHRALENGYDRIIFLGGDCDSVDKMENDDPFYAKARAFLASPGGGCIETSPAPAVHLPRRKVKTEYSTAEEDDQADAWNPALDAVQELNR